MATKVNFSAEERQLMQNAAVILTKNAIIQKIYELFGNCTTAFKQALDAVNQNNLIYRASPKISRGENYEGLPWVALDFIRIYEKQDILAVRALFWWGNFISLSILIKGIYLEQYGKAVTKQLATSNNEWLLCLADNPWEHHLRNDIVLHSNTDKINEHDFIKITTKIPLQEWDNFGNILAERFTEIISGMMKA